MSEQNGDALRVQEIMARHHGERISTEASAPEYCPQCIVRWPCELGVLLARLDALTAERDRLRLGMESWRTAAQSNLQAHPADVQRLTDERDALAARLAAAEAALKSLSDAAAPFAKRMQQAVEHQEKWRADHPGQMPLLLNSDNVPHHWTYTPTVGEARRLVAALAGSREQAAGEGD